MNQPPHSLTPPADFLFRGGKVYTVNHRQPWAETLAVKGNRIVFVGKETAANAWTSSATRVVDMNGGLLLPGFIDGHNHYVAGAIVKRGVLLRGAKDKGEVLERLRRYVAANPGQPYYLGNGWNYVMLGGELASRQDLDAIAGVPVLLFNDDTHNVWFNTAAMQAAHIGMDTPDPDTACYARYPDGAPSGVAEEMEAWMPMALACGAICLPEDVAGNRRVLEESAAPVFELARRSGITTCHDMGMFGPDLAHGYYGLEMLLDWEKCGRLPLRLVGVYGVRDPLQDPVQAVATLQAWNRKYRSNLLQVTSLKIWADGTPGSHTAVQLLPYADDPATCGESLWTADLLAQWIETAYRAGFDVHIHAMGDGSIRRALDAYEAVGKKMDTSARRPALHHLTVIHPADLPRFKQLGVGGNATLEWLVSFWDDNIRTLGKARVAQEVEVWKRLITAGVNVTFGSDLPGTDPDELSPLYQMQTALTRRVVHIHSKALPPLARIPSLHQMIYGYTLAGAYQLRMEDRLGSLQAGKLADLVLLEHSPFTTPKEELSQIKVVLSMVGGRVVVGA